MTPSPRDTTAGWKNLPTFVLNEARITRDAGGVVSIPYFRASGKLHNLQLVAPSGRAWWKHAGRRLLPFGLESLTDPPHDLGLLIGEGVSDALALRVAYQWGYDVIAIPGANTWRRDWLLWLDPYRVVYVLSDGDPAGDSLAAAIERDRPDVRIVRMPRGLDARAVLQSEGPAALDLLLEQSDVEARERDGLRRVYEAMMQAETIEDCERLLRGEKEFRDAA